MISEQGQLNAIDVISVASFLLGLENLMENRQQTADNDVSKANETQAEFLLTELNKKFDEQNKMLNEILEELHKNENTDGRN